MKEFSGQIFKIFSFTCNIYLNLQKEGRGDLLEVGLKVKSRDFKANLE